MRNNGRSILVATHNQGKVREYAELLADLDVRWLGLDEVAIDWDVDETGDTFEANAILKATTYARASGLLTLADDSGLEVDALDGRPGVYTARFGGEGLTPKQRYRLLLRELVNVDEAARTARFRCAVALAEGETLHGTATGIVEGKIAHEPRGDGGFGYDPVFFVADQGQTMAQLSPAIKNRISHRARALQAILPLLQEVLART